jgi:hypothetical protein
VLVGVLRVSVQSASLFAFLSKVGALAAELTDSDAPNFV